MRNTRPIKRDRGRERILENLVYLELRHEGYTTYIGTIGGTKVDFIASKREETNYIQVCLALSDEKTRE